MPNRRHHWMIAVVIVGAAFSGFGAGCEPTDESSKPDRPPATPAMVAISIDKGGLADFKWTADPKSNSFKLSLNSEDVSNAIATLEVFSLDKGGKRKSVPFTLSLQDGNPPTDDSTFGKLLGQKGLTDVGLLEGLRGVSITVTYADPSAPTKDVSTKQDAKTTGATTSDTSTTTDKQTTYKPADDGSGGKTKTGSASPPASSPSATSPANIAVPATAAAPTPPAKSPSISGLLLAITPDVNLRNHLPNSTILTLRDPKTGKISSISVYPGSFSYTIDAVQKNVADVSGELAASLTKLRLKRFSAASVVIVSFAPPAGAGPVTVEYKHSLPAPQVYYQFASFDPATPSTAAAKKSDPFLTSPDFISNDGTAEITIYNSTPSDWKSASITFEGGPVTSADGQTPLGVNAHESLTAVYAPAALSKTQALIWRNVLDLATTAQHPSDCYGITVNKGATATLPGGVAVIHDKDACLISQPFSDLAPGTTLTTCHGKTRLKLIAPPPPNQAFTITAASDDKTAAGGAAGAGGAAATAQAAAAAQAAASATKPTAKPKPTPPALKVKSFTNLALDNTGNISYTPAVAVIKLNITPISANPPQQIWFVRDAAEGFNSVSQVKSINPTPPLPHPPASVSAGTPTGMSATTPSPKASPAAGSAAHAPTAPTSPASSAAPKSISVCVVLCGSAKNSVNLHSSDVSMLQQISDANDLGSDTTTVVALVIADRLKIENELNTVIPGAQKQIGNLIEEESLYRANQQADDVSNFVGNTEQQITLLRRQIADSYVKQASLWRDIDGMISASADPDKKTVAAKSKSSAKPAADAKPTDAANPCKDAGDSASADSESEGTGG